MLFLTISIAIGINLFTMLSLANSSGAFAIKCPEYKARTNFIRLMAMSAKHFHMTWHIAGSFIRHLIAGKTDIKDSSMLVLLTPSKPQRSYNSTCGGVQKMIENVTSMVNELEIMGMRLSTYNPAPFVSKGLNGLAPSHVSVSFEAEMFIAGSGNITFPVTIKAFDNEMAILDKSLHSFSTDTIVLSATSLHVIKKDDMLDTMNQNAGISLLERMVKIQQEKSIVQVKSFTKIDGFASAATNAILLNSIKEMKAEGFNIIGDTIETSQTCKEGLCPICLEMTATFVQLECSHSFCLSCLAEHMMSCVTGAECPMCRARVSPCTKVSM